MITLSSQTSHVLQPLNVYHFKSFKITLKKARDVVMSKNNHVELYKITLIGLVDQVLEQSLTNKNIKFGFKVIDIWPFNLKVMDSKV
jgi:hypothetical protein